MTEHELKPDRDRQIWASVNAGEWLAAEGWWVRDQEHGLQFKAITLKTVPPTKVEGIERYLGSGLVKGIGPILAKKLVEKETRTAVAPLTVGGGRLFPTRQHQIFRATMRYSLGSSLYVITSNTNGLRRVSNSSLVGNGSMNRSLLARS